MGWIVETIYVSILEKRYVNRGFLKGPFCPVYGFGGIIIIQSLNFLNDYLRIESESIVIKILLAMLLTTILEYVTGYILEKLFNCKWWDYSTEFLNLHGRVCVKYSIFWGILSYILVTFIYPIFIKFSIFGSIPLSVKYILAVIVILYFILDTVKSVSEIVDLKQFVFTYSKYPMENIQERVIELRKYKRILQAFPKLYFFKLGKLNLEIRRSIENEYKRIKTKIKRR